MKKSSLASILLIIISIAGFYAWQNFFLFGGSPVKMQIPERKIHYFGDKNKNIGIINLKVFYFVPTDRIKNIESWDFKKVLSQNFEEIKSFHALQFEGLSDINYEIHPEPVLGINDSGFYDGPDTSFGNPHALETILEELKNKFPQNDSTFIIVYEGVGAGGSEKLATSIIARGYFTQESEKELASSILYHEFAHTLGLPDEYDHEKNIPFSNDIMGAGRNKPLEITYLSQEIKEKMGF